jgi:hypothetical protein
MSKNDSGNNGDSTVKLPSQAAAKKKAAATSANKRRDTASLTRLLPNLPTKEEVEKKMIKPVAGFQKTAAGTTTIVPTETANLLPTTHVLSQEEVDDQIRKLIKMGRDRGYITYDEMNDALPGDVVSPERLDQILMRLDELKIEVVEDSPEYRVRDKKDRRHSEPKPPVDEDGRIDDPVRTYLQQMGEIPLLTRDEEIALAKKIEVTRKRFQKRVLESHVAQVQVHLAQAEEIEVFDHESRQQHEYPAEREQRPQNRARQLVLDLPDDVRHRTPLPEQQYQRETREQHVGAALDGTRHELRPPLLEAGARHHAVLHREHAEQQRIDEQGFAKRPRRARIDGFRNEEVAYESDRV